MVQQGVGFHRRLTKSLELFAWEPMSTDLLSISLVFGEGQNLEV